MRSYTHHSQCMTVDSTQQVNSGYPVMDVVQAICGDIVIKHSQELSLARDQKNTDETATQCELKQHTSPITNSHLQYILLLVLNLAKSITMSVVLDNWLDPQSSLKAQGIKDGDTLLLRYVQ